MRNTESTSGQEVGKQLALVGNTVKPWLISYNRDYITPGQDADRKEFWELPPGAVPSFREPGNAVKSTSH